MCKYLVGQYWIIPGYGGGESGKVTIGYKQECRGQRGVVARFELINNQRGVSHENDAC
jgi:hypothetical protein